MTSTPAFQSSQIVCLECAGTRLYAEVIQVVVARQMCWVRPLVLAVPATGTGSEGWQELPAAEGLWDLREGSDLLWPASLFRPALDTEVIPLLMELQTLEPQGVDAVKAHRQLREFVGQVWQAYPEVFTS